MKNELPFQPLKEQRTLEAAFAQKPHLRRRLLEISDMVDQAVAEGVSAQEAEARAWYPKPMRLAWGTELPGS